MKCRRLRMVAGLILAIMMLSTLFTFGCKAQPTTTAATTAPEVKTLNFGVVFWLGWGLGIDSKNGIEVSVDIINKAGGLSIGSEKYKLNPIFYDDNNNQAQAVSAVNKLIFEDKVKFIISGSNFEDSFYSICDSNKVVLLGGSTKDSILDPKYHYIFRANGSACFTTVLTSWMTKKYPEKKNWVVALPDSVGGHISGEFTGKVLKDSGVNADLEYYPTGSPDLSSLGTKVKTLNPDVFLATGAGVEGDSLGYKAAYQAGYRGQLFSPAALPPPQLAMMLTPEVAEGMIAGSDPVGLDPPGTKISEDFKNAWIAKIGKWQSPTLLFHMNYTCLQAALQKAGSIDPDKVAEAIATGLQWDGPSGAFKMIDRPDKGNSRTVDCVFDLWPVKITGGKAVLIEHISLADSYATYKKYNQ